MLRPRRPPVNLADVRAGLPPRATREHVAVHGARFTGPDDDERTRRTRTHRRSPDRGARAEAGGAAAWPALRPALYALLDYGKARRMADAIAPLRGREALDYLSASRVKVETRFVERMPLKGRVIVICNHPTGIADGIALYDALKGVRPDLVFYANSDALRVAPRLDDMLIPVEWVGEKRTRDRTRVTFDNDSPRHAGGASLGDLPGRETGATGRAGAGFGPAVGEQRLLRGSKIQGGHCAPPSGGPLVDAVPFFPRIFR